MSMRHDGKQTVLVIAGGEIADQRLVNALALDPRYRPAVITRMTEIATALTGVDMVVNCIAGNPRTIVATTKALCDAARRNPPRRIVYLSSMSVYGGAEGAVDERTRPEPPLNAYARGRIACEALVRQYVADGGDAVIIRPTCVFGPGSEPWASRIARLLLSKRLGDLGRLGDGLCNLVHVDDLVATMIAALSAPDVTGETFNATADWPRPTWNEFLIRFARAIGATPVRRISARKMQLELKLLAPLLRAAALAADRVGAGTFVPDAMTPSFVRLLGQNITVSGAKASVMMGITHIPLDQAIDETAHWWRSRSVAAAAGSRIYSAASLASASHSAASDEAGR
jgi:nucleoside-diphosphate-sugar epimerase